MNIRNFIILFLGAFACLYLTFSPTVIVPYTHSDSMRYFNKFYDTTLHQWQVDNQFKWLNAIARPIAAQEEEIVYKNVNNLSDLSKLRFATIVVFALCAAMLGIAVVSLGVQAIPAFCISTAIFTLPGVQECIFVPYIFIAIALFFSLSAQAVWNSKFNPVIRFISAFIMLNISLFTYLPTAFFFLIPASFIVILNGDKWGDSKKIWIRDLVFGVIVAVFYLIIVKVFFYKNIELTGHHTNWASTLLCIKAFLPYCAPQIFNLWNVYYSKVLGISMIIAMGVFLTMDLLVTKKIGPKRLLALSILFLVFNFVWFAFCGYMPRQFMAAQGLVLALFYWCGQRLVQKVNNKNGIL